MTKAKVKAQVQAPAKKSDTKRNLKAAPKTSAAKAKAKVAPAKQPTPVQPAQAKASQVKVSTPPVKVNEVSQMPLQNHVRKPKPGGTCANIWATAEKLSKEKKRPVQISELLEALPQNNPATVKTEFNRYRKFNGIAPRASKAA